MLSTFFQRCFPSLRSRILWTALFVVAVFVIVAGWVLQNAFESGLVARLKTQLEVQTYALLGVADENQPGSLYLPEALTDDRLNQLESGRYARVIGADNNEIWRSLSAQGLVWEFSDNPGSGESHFFVSNIDGKDVFQRDYGVTFESATGDSSYTFQVAEYRTGIDNALEDFNNQLYSGLGVLGLALLLVQFIFLHYGLGPLKSVSNELNSIEQGDIERLRENYPTELKGLAQRINQLLHFEQAQRIRYRDSLGDLAHSLKTPLSVLRTSIEKNTTGEVSSELDTQLLRINKTISYYLNRASARGAGSTLTPIKVSLVIEPLIKALKKVYFEKNIQCHLQLDETAIFYGHEGDLLELLGNLLDNAFKYGKNQISLEIKKVHDGLSFIVEDDGEGIAVENRAQVMKRGARLDEVGDISGHGIGLSVVADIVKAYEGSIHISESKLGGAKFKMIFDGRA